MFSTFGKNAKGEPDRPWRRCLNLKQGLQEVDDFLGGKRAGFKVTVPADVDVKASARGSI